MARSRAAAAHRRVSRALDREGGLPQGHRRGHLAPAPRGAARSRRLDRRADPSPLGTVASIAVEAGRPHVEIDQWVPPAVSDRPRVGDPGGRPIDKFRGTAVGGVLAAGLLGLRDALEPRKDEEIAIVRDDAGGPPPNDPIELELDPEHPEESVVRVRPWLRDPPAKED